MKTHDDGGSERTDHAGHVTGAASNEAAKALPREEPVDRLGTNYGFGIDSDQRGDADDYAEDKLKGQQIVRSLDMPEATSPRYPDHLMPFVGSQQDRNERFADAVEEFLLNYGYNTARAYRSDLEDIYTWAEERGLDFFVLTDADFKRYIALMRRRRYSEGTVRRRNTAWRMFTAGGHPTRP